MIEGTVRHLWFVDAKKRAFPRPEGARPDVFESLCGGCAMLKDSVAWRELAGTCLCESCYAVWYEIRFL